MQKPFFSNLMLSPMSVPPLHRIVEPILLMMKGGTLMACDSCEVDSHCSSAWTTLWPKKSCSERTFGVKVISTSIILPPCACPTTMPTVPVSGFCITITSAPTGYSSSSFSHAFFSSCRESSWLGTSAASWRGYRRVSPSNTFLSSPRALRTMPERTMTSTMTCTSPTSSPRLVMHSSLSILASLTHLSLSSGEWLAVLSCPSRDAMRHVRSLTALTWHSLRKGQPT
mmetsp:Transcript_23316/g.58458  ORF Transcript_23316/g.58458 Transcript_23316/m.58458 type:complete len:227 (-) Transcript_23316:931-1611(-)